MDIITYALLKGKIKKASRELEQLEQAVETLNGDSSTPGSVQYQIAEVIAGAPEEYNTLMEIAQWLSEHEDDYTAVLEDIINLKAQKTALKNADGTYNSQLTIGQGLKIVNNNLMLDTVEITQDEYDALTPEEQNNGTVYYIVDANAGGDIVAGTGITITVMQNGNKQISVDLVDSVTTAELPITSKAVKTALEAQALTAGTNIDITNGVISATDTTYSAGANIAIDVNNQISATDTVYSAGTGITINSNNEINVTNAVPAATSADNGKVLMVNNQGNWTAQNIHKDLISFDYDENTDTLTSNKTNLELLSAKIDDRYRLNVTPKITGATVQTIENLYQVVNGMSNVIFIFVGGNRIYSITVDSSTMSMDITNARIEAGDNVSITWYEPTDSLKIATTANTKKQEVTQAQYDALTTAQKKNGTVYFITDAQGNNYSAGTGINITNNVISVAPDTAFSSTSENAVQNKVINAAVLDINEKFGDYLPKTNPVYNGTFSTNTSNALGNGSIALGVATSAVADTAYAEGFHTTASGIVSHAEGHYTFASTTGAHAEGYRTTASGEYSHVEGLNTIAFGRHTHAEGGGTTASGNSSHAEGELTSIGENTTAAHAEGYYTFISTGVAAHAEGYYTSASNNCAHTEGSRTVASGNGAHAEGNDTTASGEQSHTEGGGTLASGQCSHAEGGGTTASGNYSHAEGAGAFASGFQSHAEGAGTLASGAQSHAEGGGTTASGEYSHASGYGTIANEENQYAIGKFNSTVTDALFIVGNGDASTARSNAFVVKDDGDAELAGDLIINNSTTAVNVGNRLLPASTIADEGKLLSVNSSGVAEWITITNGNEVQY